MRCPKCGTTLTAGFCEKCGYSPISFTPEEEEEFKEGLVSFSFGPNGIEVDEDNTGSDNMDFADFLAGKMNLFRDGLNGDESIDDVSGGFAQMMSNASREYNEDKGKKSSTSKTKARSKSSSEPKDEFTYGQRKNVKCDGYTVYIPDDFELDTDTPGRDFVAYKFFGSSKNKSPEQAGIRFYSSVLMPFPAGSTLSEASKSANQLYETAMLPGMKALANAMGGKGVKVTDITSDRNAGSMISIDSKPMFFHYPAIITASGLQQFRVDVNTEDLKISYKESFEIAKKLIDKIITGVDYDDVDSSKNTEKALFGAAETEESNSGGSSNCIPNLFVDSEIINKLLKTDEKEPAVGTRFTVDVTDVPFWFSFSVNEKTHELKAFLQGELYNKDISVVEQIGGAILDTKTSELKVSTIQMIGDNMVSMFHACRRIAVMLEDKSLRTLFEGLDSNYAGVKLYLERGKIRWKVVSGRERPALTVRTLLGQYTIGRPYIEDFYERSAIDDSDHDGLVASAEAGNTVAMKELADAYRDGDPSLGIEQDPAECVRWMKELADNGDSESMFNLGLHTAKGFGVKRNFKAAAEWMNKAAQAGDKDAIELAEKYGRMAIAEKKAKEGDAKAQAELASGLMSLGTSLDQAGPGKDFEESLKWAKKSAAQDCPDAFWTLALAYHHGRGVSVDMSKAAEYYQKGADLGNAACQHNLGIMYINGVVQTKNSKKGFELIKRSAEQGYGLAMRDLGVCYQLGNGTKSDLNKAIEWFEKALKVIDDPELKYKLMLLKGHDSSDEDDEDLFGNDKYGTGVVPDEIVNAWKYEDELDESGFMPDAPHGDEAWDGLPRIRRKAAAGDEKAIRILKELDGFEQDVQGPSEEEKEEPVIETVSDLDFEKARKYENDDLTIFIPKGFKYTGKNKNFKMYRPGKTGVSDASVIFGVQGIMDEKELAECKDPGAMQKACTVALYKSFDKVKKKALSYGVVERDPDKIYASYLWGDQFTSLVALVMVVLKDKIYIFEYECKDKKHDADQALCDLDAILAHIIPKKRYARLKAIDSSYFFSKLDDKSIGKWIDNITDHEKAISLDYSCSLKIADFEFKNEEFDEDELHEKFRGLTEKAAERTSAVYSKVYETLQGLDKIDDDQYKRVVEAALAIDMQDEAGCSLNRHKIKAKTNAKEIKEAIRNLERYTRILDSERSEREERRILRAKNRINPNLKDFEGEVKPVPPECQKMIDSAMDKIRKGRKADARKASDKMIDAYPDVAEAVWTHMLIRLGAKCDEDLMSGRYEVDLSAKNEIFRSISIGSADFCLEKIKVLYAFAEEVRKSIRCSFIDDLLVWDFDERDEMLTELVERSKKKKAYDVIERILMFLKLPEENARFVEWCDKYYLSSKSDDLRSNGYDLLKNNGLGWGAAIYDSGEISEETKHRVMELYNVEILRNADELYGSGDHKGAYAKYTEMLASDPNNGWILYSMSKCAAKINSGGHVWETKEFKDYLNQGDDTLVDRILEELSDENDSDSIKSAMNSYLSRIDENEKKIEEIKKKITAEREKTYVRKESNDGSFIVLIIFSIIAIPVCFILNKTLGYLALLSIPIEIIAWIISGISTSISNKAGSARFEKEKQVSVTKLTDEIKPIQSFVDSTRDEYDELCRIMKKIVKKKTAPEKEIKLAFSEGKSWDGSGIEVMIPDGFAVKKDDYDSFRSWSSVFYTGALNDTGADIIFYSDGSDDRFRKDKTSAPQSYADASSKASRFTAEERDPKLKGLKHVTTDLNSEKNGIFGKIFSIDTAEAYEHYISIITKYGFQYLKVEMYKKNINMSMKKSIEYVKTLCLSAKTYGMRSYSRTASRPRSYYFTGDAEAKACNERIAKTLAKYGSDNIGNEEFIAACLVSGVDPTSIEQKDLDYIQHLLNQSD